MSQQTTILIAGLTMAASKRLAPGMDTAAFGTALERSMNALHHIPGLYHYRFHLDPEAPSDHPTSLSSFRRALSQGPPSSSSSGTTVDQQVWSACLIGLGIKRIPALTGLFETMVNDVAVAGKGDSKVLFLITGEDHWEAVKRGFPGLEMGVKGSGEERGEVPLEGISNVLDEF